MLQRLLTGSLKKNLSLNRNLKRKKWAKTKTE